MSVRVKLVAIIEITSWCKIGAVVVKNITEAGTYVGVPDRRK